MKYYSCLLLFYFFAIVSDTIYGQNKSIDVQHYRFEISLNDTNNIIHGNAGIDFIVRQSASMVYFDLVGINDSTGKGMKIINVSEDGTILKFKQEPDRVNIYLDSPLPLDEYKDISISYEGVPSDGLIIDTN